MQSKNEFVAGVCSSNTRPDMCKRVRCNDCRCLIRYSAETAQVSRECDVRRGTMRSHRIFHRHRLAGRQILLRGTNSQASQTTKLKRVALQWCKGALLSQNKKRS